MKEIKVEISNAVKNILEQGRAESNLYYLPQIQLDRTEYVEINKILELLGGKWNRTKRAHIFSDEKQVQSILGSLEKGEVIDKKKTYQFFETPKEIAEQMVKLADIKYQDYNNEDISNDVATLFQDVIEPSAGHGAICDEIDQQRCLFRCTEIDPEKAKVLEEKGYPVACMDFLTSDEKADRFIMNPPFTRGQDADHVLHAYKLLRKGGRLVSVMSASVEFNQQKKYAKIRALIEEKGEIIKLPPNSFKESGTNVNCVLIKLDK